MAFIEEVDTVISEGLEAFKAFILKNKQANKSYLEQLFWVSNLGGLQRTVLNHLIHRHQEQMVAQDSENTTNLTVFIDYVIGESLDKNLGEPLHQAIEEGKKYGIPTEHMEKFLKELLSVGLGKSRCKQCGLPKKK